MYLQQFPGSAGDLSKYINREVCTCGERTILLFLALLVNPKQKIITIMFNSDCMTCAKEVTEGSKAIGCERCDDWFHVDCVGLRDTNMKTLKCKNLIFLCKKCLAVTKKEWKAHRKIEEENERKQKESSEGTETQETVVNKERLNPETEHNYASVEKNRKEVEKGHENQDEEETITGKEGEEQKEGDSEPPKQHCQADMIKESKTCTWLGVGAQAWRKVLGGRKMKIKSPGKLKRKLWLFGDSLLKGVGREIHYLTEGYYRIMDRTKGGADIESIKETVHNHLKEMETEDLVVIEGGGNGLEYKEEQKTISAIDNIVEQIKSRISTKPQVMCIPKRREKERERFGIKRKVVNQMIIENLEGWGCDGLHLWEAMDWNEVWTRDGVHLENIGQVWVAWNMVEWAQLQQKGGTEK